jgi:diamine N-acetyltransferase
MIRLVALDRFNWEAVAALKVDEDQQKFIPDNLFSIAQSRFEPSELYGIYENERPVGFVLICVWSKIHWITRIMVGHHHQGKGFGKRALEEVIKMLRRRSDCYEIRASVHHKNTRAVHIFESLGFTRMDDSDPNEIFFHLLVK